MDRIRIIVEVFVVALFFAASYIISYSGEVPAMFIFHGREIDISTDFDNGWLARVEERETNIFHCWPYDYEHYKWDRIFLKSMTRESQYDNADFCFHFRINGGKDKKITLNFHVKDSQNPDISSVLYANPDFPVYSYNEENWWRTDEKSLKTDPADSSWSIVTVKLNCIEDTMYIAFQYPYSNTYLDRLIKRIEDSPFCSIETVGQSTEGRNIRQISITDHCIPHQKKLTVWILGLQHSTESGAGWGLQEIIKFLLTDEPVAQEARELYIFKVIPIVNVDAVSEGKGRSHSTGNNLNRLWDLESSIPEIDSIKKAMDNWISRGNRIDLFLDFHGFSAQKGQWTILMPEEAYSCMIHNNYKKFVEAMCSQITHAEAGLKSIIGLSFNTGLRRYGAVSFCIDGYIYNWNVKNTTLSSYYVSGERIWPIEDVKACGATFVKILVDYARWKQASVDSQEVTSCMLFPNYPNPFNAETTISCSIHSPCPVRIDISNILGQTVTTVLDGSLESGSHSFVWDGHDNRGRELHSGVYFVRMHVGGDIITKKMMLMK